VPSLPGVTWTVGQSLTENRITTPAHPAAKEIRRDPTVGFSSVRYCCPSDPSDPANDVYYAPLPRRAAAVMGGVVAAREKAGATVVRANISTPRWIGGPGTEERRQDQARPGAPPRAARCRRRAPVPR
jgi:hypothetical protein